MGFMGAAVMVMAVACGGGGSDPDPTVAPDAGDTAVATTSPAAKAPAAEAPAAVDPSGGIDASDSTDQDAPVGDEAKPADASVYAPPVATATPVNSNIYDEFGFSIKLDVDTTFESVNLLVNGWTDKTADVSQGLATFNYKGADVVLFWEPQESTPQELADATYELHKLSKPESDLVAINQGDLVVDGQTGSFGGFLYTEPTSGSAAGGLIGTWACPAENRSMSLSATGSDSTALQIRFDRLISGFECGI